MEKNNTILSVFTNSSFIRVLVSLFVFILLLVLLISRDTQYMADRMFWTDEIYTFETVMQPFWEIPKWTLKGYHMQPPLFYWIGHFVAKIGTDPLTLRSVSLAFYFIMIGFVIFALRELQLATRTFLCFVLIMSPFGAFAATEFKPYALAALSILISSVFFYRALNQPLRWMSAISYGLAALVLQYSLTLNSFTFGLQMVFLGLTLIYFFYKEGFKQTLSKYKPLIIVSALLCFEYILLINMIRQTGLLLFPSSPLQFDLFNYTKALIKNTILFKEEIVLIRSWALSFAPAFFLLGCITGLRRYRWITVYLILLLGGQVLFSTFMTFSRIDWISERYLVASYVSFTLLCAIGAEYLFQHLDRKTSIIIIVCLLGTTLPGSISKFYTSLNTPVFNPIIEAIEDVRCRNYPTVVLTDPLHDSIISGYVYPNDPLIIVPYPTLQAVRYGPDPAEKIKHFSADKSCFILMERPQHKVFSGKINKLLSALPGYSQKRHSITPGLNIPDSAWLFTPLGGIETKIKKDE
jgi:hypothetical protein